MSKLLPLPKPPKGVTLGLKCPQSVLYVNLTMRASLAPVYLRLYGIDHTISYNVYDNGEKCWDYKNNE